MSAVVSRLSVVAALCALLVVASSASAKTFTVTKQSDPNPGSCKKSDCSLREAVIAANQHGGTDTISLPSKSGAYTLTRTPPADSDENLAANGDLDLTDKTTVKHSGKGRATVDANDVDRAFDVQFGAKSSFSKLVITGGRAVGPPQPTKAGVAGSRGMVTQGSPEGGGIRNAATIKVTSSLIKKNRSLSYGGGIGVIDGAGVTLIGSTLTRNTAPPGSDGGGIDADSGKVVIRRSKLTNNKSGGNGGAMYFNSGQQSTIERSTLSGNSAARDGGALYLTGGQSFSLLRVSGTTISGNTAGEDGGGVSVSSNPLEMTNSTVAGNRAAQGGGGISSSGGVHRAARGGGTGFVTLNAVTVVGNKAGTAGPIIQLLGGGLQNQGMTGEAFTVLNSLVALNFSGTTRNDCSGPFSSFGHNLLGTDGACTGFNGPGDLIKPNPKLGKLKSNGGPTKTIALQNGSPAIGKASKQSAPSRDQRGHKRDSKPDIGAFER